MRILVLCRENSCRSQMAEAYLRFYAEDDITVFSGGIRSTWVHPMAIQVMAEDGIDISAFQSNSYQQYKRQLFDYLITVCDEAREVLPPKMKFVHHIHFDIPDPAHPDIPEPERIERFREIREMTKGKMLKFIGSRIKPQTPSL